MKVCILPKFGGQDKGDGGIRRIVEAQRRYLPALGIEIVDSIEQADLVNTHAGDLPDVPVGKPWVCSNHGLYWSEYEWWEWCYKLNEYVIDAMRKADAVTAPSEWVAYALKRGMWLNPTVLYHGIDPELWGPAANQGYVLWNKTRTDPICDPAPLDAMAQQMPKTQFLTTFGNARVNVKVTGRLPFDKSRQLVAGAEVYLATTRETMGIGTLEAMACGVPILGYNWGGQKEIIEHKVTGWLVEPHDIKGLIEGYHWLKEHRDEVGKAAREVCMEKYTWPKVMEDYARLYEDLVKQSKVKRPKVSVVMPCYNLAQYLPDAIDSVRSQSIDNWELVIVDDCSPDNTPEVAQDYMAKDRRIRYVRNEKNLYLAGALNAGIAVSKGRYILPLDADNLITSQTLELLSDYMDANRGTAIAYGKVQFVKDDLTPDTNISPDGISVWPPKFDFRAQITHRNQIPSTCMYRREVAERSGGYRSRWKTAEDAAFWTHVTSMGFKPEKATEQVTLIYRNRHDSMSRVNVEPDWTTWIPWSKHKELIPFGAPMEWGKRQPEVPSCEPAVITVVIPVGPMHTKLVIDALDSVEAQTFRSWHCIVVNDTGHELKVPHPWARVINTRGREDVAVARNLGIAASTTETFVLLDADDILDPEALEEFWNMYQKEKKVIYSQWFDDKGLPEIGIYNPPDWDPEYLLKKGCIHAITAIYPKSAWEKVGGFDPLMKNWEDWAFQISLAVNGFCSCKLSKPLWTYRKTTGSRREEALATYAEGRAQMMDKFGEYFEGREKLMGCGGCGSRKAITPSNDISLVSGEMKREGAVMIEYVGRPQSLTIRGKETNRSYKFGNDAGHKRRWVFQVDAPEILKMAQNFRVAEESQKAEPVLK